jgi:hypothetical protein
LIALTDRNFNIDTQQLTPFDRLLHRLPDRAWLLFVDTGCVQHGWPPVSQPMPLPSPKRWWAFWR